MLTCLTGTRKLNGTPACLGTDEAISVWLQKLDAQRITDFILQHQPHVVVIGASVPEAAQLGKDLQTISDKILDSHADILTRFDTGMLLSPDTLPC